jgi:hypothetical protein
MTRGWAMAGCLHGFPGELLGRTASPRAAENQESLRFDRGSQIKRTAKACIAVDVGYYVWNATKLATLQTVIPPLPES